MSPAQTQLKYWLVELQTLQEEISGDGAVAPSTSPSLRDDLRKAMKRVQQFQKKVARERPAAAV